MNDPSINQGISPRELRRPFLAHIRHGLRTVWPILFGLLVLMAALSSVVALLEGWGLFDGLYFAFVSGLTIGYGDLVPKGAPGRVLAIAIGFVGILFAALVAALGVQALDQTRRAQR